uniref:Uncharacterized protein n=1 Tax=Oryza punctata TaxID=4537 RepID=A0A0E0M0H9_ORYPU
MRPGGPLEHWHGQPGRGGDNSSAMRGVLKPATSFLLGISPFTEAACHYDHIGRASAGRGDPLFSLTLSLFDLTTWMELKRTRGVGAVATRRRGLANGNVEYDIHSLARESGNYGGKPSIQAGNDDTYGCRFPLGVLLCFSILSQWVLQVKTMS